MMNLLAIYNEWQNNLSFREQFKTNPEEALKKVGFEVTPADLEKIRAMVNIDKSTNDNLDDRISK